MNDCGFSPQEKRFNPFLINIQNCLREVLISEQVSLLWNSPNSLSVGQFLRFFLRNGDQETIAQ